MSVYKSMEGTNQSSLKKIITHPQLYLQAKKKQEESKETDEVEKDHLVFGSVVDIMLTGTREEFDETFVKVSNELKCSDAIKQIVRHSLIAIKSSEEETKELSDYPEVILAQARGLHYQDRQKNDTLIATVIKEGEEYFNFLKLTENKKLITELDYAKAVNCMMALKSDQFTKKYTVKEKGIVFWDKVIVQFDKHGRKIKGELDRVVINNNNETITPLDFKTTGLPIYTFNSEFWKYRYDIQATVYTEGLLHLPEIKDLLSKGYKLNNFKYIVVEKELINHPMVFNVTPEVIFMGKYGGERSLWKLEGFEKSLERLTYAEQNNAWNYPMEYYQNGELDIRI